MQQLKTRNSWLWTLSTKKNSPGQNMSTKIHLLKMSTRIRPFWKKESTRIHWPREFPSPVWQCDGIESCLMDLFGKKPYRYFVWQKYNQNVPGAPLSTAVLSLPLHSGGKWGITSEWLMSFKLKEPQRSVCLMELVDYEMFHTSNQDAHLQKSIAVS